MTMKAAIFRGPFMIEVEERPKPNIVEPTDAIVRVTTAGLCGSELHMYRGHQKTNTGHIMGHEFVGFVEEAGEKVKNFRSGERVVCTFSAVCLECWFCVHGYTNRCIYGMAFGTQQLDGGQAEYVRVPFADGTLQKAPDTLSDELLIMMCDIFPTGYYGASRAIDAFTREKLPDSILPATNGTANASGHEFLPQSIHDAVFVCLGCGPVGLCAILTAKSKGVRTIYVVDSVDDRLEEAEKMGGIPLKLGRDNIQETVLKATDGRGADAVVEVVGSKLALRSAFDLLRQCGVLSSIGFHQGDLPFTALECYQKNLNVNFGRAPVRAVYREALEYLAINKEKLGTFVSHKLPLKDAAEGYSLFEQHKARKVVFSV